MNTNTITQQREVIYWRLLSSTFGLTEEGGNFERMSAEVVDEVALPSLILNPTMAIDSLLHRYPELDEEFKAVLGLSQGELSEQGEPDVASLRRGLIFSKLLLNVFGPNTQNSIITAQQYAQWRRDVASLEQACGFAPGSLLGKAGRGGQGGLQIGQAGQGKQAEQGALQAADGDGGANAGSGGLEGRLQEGRNGVPLDEEQLRATLAAMEQDLIKRMALREVLQDNQLASQLTPSMALVEQLLRDKAHLSGVALKNAKRLILQYVGELAEVLKLQVEQAISPKIDYSVPPKRVYRNLDLKRTLWKNLINWNPEEKRLYVDKLYYHHASRKKTPTRMIVVVDQSGSMVNAMVQCTILASIFASLPMVDVHLVAFDTRVLDLTPWIHDPFEVLLRTQLGGGTHIYEALLEASHKILEPRNTAVVLISDFYEGGSDQVLFDYIKSLKESGVHFIPVGAVTSSGYFSVHQWFRTKLKELGTPILTGSPKKLIEELKKVIVV